jgi:hypothetical protein
MASLLETNSLRIRAGRIGLSRALVTFCAALLLAGAAGTVARPSGGAQRHRASGRAPVLDGCVRLGSQTKIVTFGAGRGDVLHAVILGHGSTGVVLSNQSDRDLCSWLPFAHSLTQAGYRVLLFDYGNAEPWLEVAAAARTLHRLGSTHVALIGASEGAKASIIAAARPGTAANSVVSLSAERYLRGTDVKPWAAKLRRPILFLMAKQDPFTISDTLTLYRACGSPSKQLVTLAGDAHGVDLLAGATGAHVRENILAFLRRHT